MSSSTVMIHRLGRINDIKKGPMNDDAVNIDKIKEMFAKSSGEKMIEVTEGEYEQLLKEAVQKKLKLQKDEGSFTLIMDHLSIKIVSADDEEDDGEDWE